MNLATFFLTLSMCHGNACELQLIEDEVFETAMAFSVPGNYHKNLHSIRQIQCLAETIYAEAGALTATDDDRALTAQVTLTRGDPCKEIAVTKPVKQYPWFEGHLDRRKEKIKKSGLEQYAWEKSVLMAVRVYTGEYVLNGTCSNLFYYNHVGGKNPTGKKKKADCVTGKMQGWRE